MRKIQETFEWQIRKHINGALMECDIYFDIVEPEWIREAQKFISEPLATFKPEEIPENSKDDEVMAIVERNKEAFEKANGEVNTRLHDKFKEKFSSKNKDLTIDEVVAIFHEYPAVLSKFILKWHEVCFKQTFRGLELDKDSTGN